MDVANLVQQAQQGDHQAFGVLIHFYEAPVKRRIKRWLPPTDVDDASQAIFLRLWRNIHKFDSTRSFAPWLYRITDNACIDQIRNRTFNPEVQH